MPSSMLFGINNEGRVYSLYTNGTKWREFPYLGVEFKKLSSVPNFLWAMGGDRQIYVHVHGFDIPIRIKEEVYENQRWNPIEGFVSRLLPTDRYQWSNKDGTQSRNIETIRLPSMAWQWETEWQKETTLDGQPLDVDAWTYAIDFPSTYTPSKQWASTVRRRKWFRYRRYSAMNAWCAIAPLHKDPTKEPFIDVCVGGHCLSGDNLGSMLVWAVTAQGRLMFRSGVSKFSPEGQKWIHIKLPPQNELICISCGPTGLTWAVTFTGQIIVRSGITCENPMGDSWLTDIDSPEEGNKIQQISVGTNSAWALSEDNRVWFRKGISSSSPQLIIGTGWIEMVGKMSSISVAGNDQVWAVGFDDQRIYYRMGVTPSELTGRKWRPLNAPIQLSRNSTQSNSLLSFGKQSTIESSITEECDFEENTSKSAPTRLTSETPNVKSSPGTTDNSQRANVKFNSSSLDCVVVSEQSTRLWSPLRAVGSLIGMEVNPDTDDSGLDADTERDAFLEKQNESLSYKFRVKWSCVEAGAVYVSPNNIPDWFVYDKSQSIDERAPWKIQILTSLQERRDRETRHYEKYELAIKITSWIKSIQCKVQLPGSTKLGEMHVELAWIGDETNRRDQDLATISFLTLEARTVKLDLNIRDVTSVQSATEPDLPKIKIFSCDLEPIILAFSTDTDHDDCMAHMIFVCCRLYKIRGAPSNRSFWVTTALGEVLVFDPLVYEGFHPKDKGLLCQIFNTKEQAPPVTHTLVNSFSPGSQLIVTGNISQNADRFSIDLECGSEKQIALHVNPRFKQNQIVRNCKIDGEWKTEETYGSIFMEVDSDFMLTIICEQNEFHIWRNGSFLATYKYTLDPATITQVTIRGDVVPMAIKYLSNKPSFNSSGIFWRQIGGHLKHVETCDIGVTWGIGFDKTSWVYTGGWGGSLLMGLERSEGINVVTDTHVFEVYENQRWNPLSGYTPRGLPTDRYMWSDETGKQKMTKDSCRLANMHWHWETDWTIDYNAKGGVCKDGWQYALDFPCVYHRKKLLTDTVRRRKWIRIARYISTGPWLEVGNTKLNDISLHTDVHGNIHVWAIVSNGDVLYRRDVTLENPSGISWEHVSHDAGLINISGHNYQVWAISEEGCAFYRYGISASNVVGESWQRVDPPKGKVLSQICVGHLLIWARDVDNNLHVRQGVTSVCVKGSHWESLTDGKMKFISISGNEVWGISEENVLRKRIGVTEANPSGMCWVFQIKDGWTHVSVKR